MKNQLLHSVIKASIFKTFLFFIIVSGCQENRRNLLILGSWEQINKSGKPTGIITSFGEDGFATIWERGDYHITEGAYKWTNSKNFTLRYYTYKNNRINIVQSEFFVQAVSKDTLVLRNKTHISDDTVYARVNSVENEVTNKMIGQWIAGPEVSISNRFSQGSTIGDQQGRPCYDLVKPDKYELLEFRKDGTGVIKNSNTKKFNEKGIDLQLWVANSHNGEWILSGEKWPFLIQFLDEDQLIIVFKSYKIGPYRKISTKTSKRNTSFFW